MAGEYEFYYSHDGTDYKMPCSGTEDSSWRNVAGTPCTQVVPASIGSVGCFVPSVGVYRVTYESTSVNTYWNGWVTCDTDHIVGSGAWNTCMDNLYKSGTLTGYVEVVGERYDGHFMNRTSAVSVVTSSGDTPHLVPGSVITVNNQPRAENVFDVFVGELWLDAEGRSLPVLSMPVTPSGSTSSPVQLKVKCNVVGGVTDAKLVMLNHCSIKQTQPLSPFAAVWQISSITVDSVYYLFRPVGTGSYPVNITFQNYSASDSTIDILIDGKPYDVMDLSTSTPYPDGEALSVDGSTAYVFLDSAPCAGMAFILSGATDASTAQLRISNGASLFETKLASSSSWSFANDYVSIGAMAEGSTTAFDVRASIPSDIDDSDNPHEALLFVEDQDSNSYFFLPFLVRVAEADTDSLIIRASVYPNEDPASDVDATSTTTSPADYNSTTLEVQDGDRFLTGGIVALTDGTHTDYFKITSKSGDTLTVSPLDDDGLGNDGDQYTGYAVGSTVRPVTGRNDMIGKYKEFGITFS